MAKLILLFGGTFDPVHYGHLKPLEELRQYLSADRVYVIPASVPPHRAEPAASAAQRLHMLELALAEFPEFIIDTRELDRPGPSWMVLTLQSFREQYPDDSLCLVMGGDAFNGLPSWYHWQEIPELANIIVVQRAGQEHDFPEWANKYRVASATDLRERHASCVLPVTLTGYDISATDIRRKIRSGSDVAGLLPATVLNYIQDQGLFLETRANEHERGN